jgi:hypothetical protein
MTSSTDWWHTHGTKILGVVTALVGVAGESLSLIQAYDPKRSALWALVVGIAMAIVKRGYTNQDAIEQRMLSNGWTPPPKAVAPPPNMTEPPKP